MPFKIKFKQNIKAVYITYVYVLYTIYKKICNIIKCNTNQSISINLMFSCVH